MRNRKLRNIRPSRAPEVMSVTFPVPSPEEPRPEVALTESAPYGKYVLRMRNWKLRNIGPSRAPEVTLVTFPVPSPEVALTGSMFCACATGSCTISALVGPFFLTSTSTMVTEGHPKGWKGYAHVQPEVVPFSQKVGYRK